MECVLIAAYWLVPSGTSCQVAAEPGPAAGRAEQEPATRTSSGLAVVTVAERRIVTNAVSGVQIRFVPAERLAVGDEIYFTLRVRNTAAAPIDDAVIVKPIPRNVLYVDDSAVGPAAAVAVSIDGGVTFAAPEDSTVHRIDGTTRQAIATDYTHIRWQLKHPLAPGATALLRFRGVFR